MFGAAADRWSRRNCLIVSDVLRGSAFLGIALVDSFAATVALALVAGAGSGSVQSRVARRGPQPRQPEERLPAATALYGAITDLGFIVGPALAALLLLFGGPDAPVTSTQGPSRCRHSS